MSDLYRSIVDQVPQLKRGQCWCHTCGKEVWVNPAACLRSGWPMCCGETMSIDSPEERKRMVGGRNA